MTSQVKLEEQNKITRIHHSTTQDAHPRPSSRALVASKEIVIPRDRDGNAHDHLSQLQLRDVASPEGSSVGNTRVEIVKIHKDVH